MNTQVGFNAGDGHHYFSLSGSRTDQIINITSTSNMDIHGRWLFRLDSHVIKDGGCNTQGNAPDFWRPQTMGITITWKDVLLSLKRSLFDYVFFKHCPINVCILTPVLLKIFTFVIMFLIVLSNCVYHIHLT